MTKKKKATEKQQSFEELMGCLEGIAGELESGELGLEKAIERYEEGVKCYKKCHKILTGAEKKVEILTRSADGELEAVPFGDVAGEETGEGKSEESSDSEEDDDASLF